MVVFCICCVIFAYVSDYNFPTGTGNLCLILFLAANVYIPAKYLRKRYRFSNVQPFFDWLLSTHGYLNIAAFITSLVHCYNTSWDNNWLYAGLVLMGVLTLNGLIMNWRNRPEIKKGIYFLHTQQIVFVCLLYVMLKGHYVFTWLPP